MQSTELRDLTASEELTLEEEYAMQREPSLPSTPTFRPKPRIEQEAGRKTRTVRGPSQCHM
jgi:hypothetical protein